MRVLRSGFLKNLFPVATGGASALLAVLLLVGCEPVTPPEEMKVRVKWMTHEEVRQKCGFSVLDPYGCAIVAGASCTIYAIKPRGFDDHAAVETLGHELLHCLWGPTHI